MAIEIERKFLVQGLQWKPSAPGVPYRQGYLRADPVVSPVTIRIRVAGDEAVITVKGPRSKFSRTEYEYPIPVEDAREMLQTLCSGHFIEKTRYRVLHGAHTWEVDEFHGANQGLVLAEIELGDENEVFDRPDWLGAEVTTDPRFNNSSLATCPLPRIDPT